MSAAKAHTELQGISLLVVEDEEMVALLLEDVLTDLGCDVVGPAFCLADAVRLAGNATIHGAILDVNLGGEKVYPAADILAARNLPFVFATGYGISGLREADKSRPVLQKPFNLGRLVDIVKQWR
jgi:CheY-like chemotaxis protein